MILGNTKINNRLVDPFNLDNVQPASYDCTLGRGFLLPEKQEICVRLSDVPQYEPIHEYGCYLGPGEFCLATTAETITLPVGIVGYVEGRSSIGRMGLFVQNAGFIDPGFSGQITLELFNASPNTILLEPGLRICQIVFMRTDGVSGGYSGKYQGQAGVVGSRINEDFER